MTEAEWLACENIQALLADCKGCSLRKYRLFACGCCRVVWEHLGQEARAAVEITEQFAEGRASKEEVRLAGVAALAETARDLDEWYRPIPAAVTARTAAGWHPAVAVAAPKATASYRFAWVAKYAEDLAERAAGLGKQVHLQEIALVRCVFGNPLTTPRFELGWRTRTVRLLAAGIYADRAFDRMPVLADALEEAGCDHADILAHCRGDGPHVRGCWVVDLVLGES